ncbi:DUF6339 family protein [Leisingera sp. JC1]|uniref:DUF6339 family protein n=1 Tax=Leisingera sp. JC1 TaxID=1855282 RepID=UPI000802E4E9|nr:DUF6339 family protein [Leisingera sp. JC1]OBY24382.1 hypothetical protein A9D60_24380 [Leisingera sp. JC1]
MTETPLKYLSEKKLYELKENVAANRDRYEVGDFLDLEHDNGWAVETGTVSVDHDLLAALDGTARTAVADIDNSLILYRALKGMTPALAREERVWARLTHVECLGYARDRWLFGNNGAQLDAQVRIHMFAPGLTAIRDDNSLSRLWWNMHIASIADPDDPEGALRLILKTLDIRSNFVERTNTAARQPLARAVVRAMRRDPWITSSARAFREFMIALNRDGGGILFEALSDEEANALMDACASRAQAKISL